MPVSQTQDRPAPAALAPGRRVYAIGDIHGCAALLDTLHDAIAADLLARPVADPTLVHLGDYIDRGPDSAGVVERLLTPGRLPGAQSVHLMGNHEAMLLAALGDPDMLPTWLANGGDATLASWGIAIPDDDPADADWFARVPSAHLDWLQRLRLRHEIDGYLFVHAGVRPDRALDRSSTHDLLWIREPFLSWPGRLQRVVVHGHTPSPSPSIRAHRIGIDTGAVFGGSLTCAVLEEDRVRFLSATAGA